MKLIIQIDRLCIVPESPIDRSYLNDTLGFYKGERVSCVIRRVDDHHTCSSNFHLEIEKP